MLSRILDGIQANLELGKVSQIKGSKSKIIYRFKITLVNQGRIIKQ